MKKAEEPKISDFPWTQRIEVSEQIKMLKSRRNGGNTKKPRVTCLEQKSLSHKLVRTPK